MYLDSGDLRECVGCTTCEQICPKDAISMIIDGEGFNYPLVDDTRCIDCGLCRKICPVDKSNNEDLSLINTVTYAAYLKDSVQRQKSSSGGLFYGLACQVIKSGGIVYGATLDDKLQCKHIGVESIYDLEKLRGSKYVQSSLNDIFKDIICQLKTKRTVYFTGTPCQVAGLKSFLHKDYENLITSDLICHGCPSHKLFSMHIKYLENKYKLKVVDYKFRDNASWSVCEIITFDNGRIIKRPSYYLSPYLYAFMQGLIYRESCYVCPFAKLPRQGDITLGDFWGVNQFFSGIDTRYGVSTVIINSKKGLQLWNACKDESCNYFISVVSDVAKYNDNLLHPSKRPPIRDIIYSKIDENGYPYIAKHYFRPSRYLFLYVKEIILNSTLLKTKFVKKVYSCIKKLAQ